LPALVVAMSSRSTLEGRMVEDSLRPALATLPPGWTGRFFERVGSTQDEARSAARLHDAPGRSIFVANEQTAGRGRHGRQWLASPGSGLMLSMVFRETGPEPKPWRYTCVVSVALAEAIERVASSLRPAVKWPNDLLLDDRKVAGILAESAWDGEHLLVIVGVGVNVGTTADELEQIGAPATSLAVASGAPVDRGELLLTLIRSLDGWLVRPFETTRAAWQSRLWGRGQQVRLADPSLDGEQHVVVLGVEADGSLRVQLADGSERITTTGELIL
jgi:BirA family biotin operon repressor/biotin-[acetyl-CoA-carboxylase] ligase